MIETETPFASAVRCFKTIAQWITGIVNRCSNGNEIIFFELLSVGCRLERCEHDTELAETCSAVLSMIAQALTLPRCMDPCLAKIDEISYSSSWSARLAIIDIMQVIVFHNMAIVMSRPEWVEKVQSIVLRLLEDSVLEVREKSAEVLGGLLHCSFLPATDKLLELFKKKCRTKVIKRSNRVTTSCAVEAANASDSDNANAIRIRHCGVLGLCAFITAYPYDIPAFVPNVFEIISLHLNDPQPIPVSFARDAKNSVLISDFHRPPSEKHLPTSSERTTTAGSFISRNSTKHSSLCSPTFRFHPATMLNLILLGFQPCHFISPAFFLLLASIGSIDFILNRKLSNIFLLGGTVGVEL